LLKEVIGLFRKDAPSSLRRIECAMRKRDSDALRMAAHALKGAIATVGSSREREVAAEIEAMAKSGKFADAEGVYAQLKEVVRELDTAMTASGFARRPAVRAARRTRAPLTRRKRGRS
ncbi:MAG: Hpt domain-containing protein, partial [Acidobacteria bacterium]|nr:Hpt domain-containing protein [Acidobacteriota bacterium]